MRCQLLILGALSSSAFSAAIPSLITRHHVPWSVAPYSSGCSPGGCSYGFNVTGEEESSVLPSFATYCSGVEKVLGAVGVGEFTPCNDDNILTAQTYNGTSRMVTLEVKRRFSEHGVIFMELGNVTYSVDKAKPTALPITPSLVYAVS